MTENLEKDEQDAHKNKEQDRVVDCTCEYYVLVVLLELNWAVLVQL